MLEKYCRVHLPSCSPQILYLLGLLRDLNPPYYFGIEVNCQPIEYCPAPYENSETITQVHVSSEEWDGKTFDVYFKMTATYPPITIGKEQKVKIQLQDKDMEEALKIFHPNQSQLRMAEEIARRSK